MILLETTLTGMRGMPVDKSVPVASLTIRATSRAGFEQD